MSRSAADPLILLAQLLRIETDLIALKYDMAAGYAGQAAKAILEQSEIKRDSLEKSNEQLNSLN